MNATKAIGKRPPLHPPGRRVERSEGRSNGNKPIRSPHRNIIPATLRTQSTGRKQKPSTRSRLAFRSIHSLLAPPFVDSGVSGLLI
ncbi:hypothetical protein RE6C_04171 [Rhodopirellula europaea 6C]|uniref:Uncharacterized protein n=1 Tax=Rhodopirellula europaea 6C TaxID=1263867 RepID=M2A540_9BACT|nr:hypothetical protein RE6C_04171 [Rhodopirellula europaea 6C]